MLQIDLIKKFLDYKSIAVVGVSRKGDIPANNIYKRFKEGGYSAYQINPYADEIDGEKCYPDLNAIPEKIEAVFFGTPPEIVDDYVVPCKETGIAIVWMHRGIGKGSYSREATEHFEQEGIEVITNGCPFMFIKPVDPFHKFIRWTKSFG